jgi:serine/threonine protein kinase
VRRIVDDAARRDIWERTAFLERECGHNVDLRAAVDAALADRDDGATQVRSSDKIPGPAPNPRLDGPEGKRSIGPYVIERKIGQGGMGIVYLAWDTRLRRRVALKILAPDIAADQTGRERLRREAQAAAALSHPNIATVYALEEIDGELILVCEFVEGIPLRVRLRETPPLSIREAVDIAVQLASGLTAAHEDGVVHRDLKPENLLLTPAGTLKVLDFGLARKEALESPRVTQSGMVTGTPAYMAPEQAIGKSDFRGDMFSFGLIVFEMVSGVNPFEGATVTETLAKRLVEFEPPSLAAAAKDCPRDLDWIVSTCLRKNPLQRFNTTRELSSALSALRDQLYGTRTPTPSSVPASSGGDDPMRWWKTHIGIISIVYAAMIYPVWLVRAWLFGSLGMVVFFAALAAAAVAISLRLHLWFMHEVDVTELLTLHKQTRPWIIRFDMVFSAALVVAAMGLMADHQGYAALFFVTGTVTAVASLFIEPATTRSAFRRCERISAVRQAEQS